MILGIVLLVVGVTLFAALVLFRTWVWQKRGVDVESEAAEADDAEKLPDKQKFILGLLVMPAVVFLAWSFALLIANVLVTALGISTTG